MSRRRVPLWPRTIRGQVTFLALVLTTVFLTPLGLAADAVIRSAVAQSLWRETRSVAARTVDAYQEARLRNPIPVPAGSRVLVQVIGPGNHVLAASESAAGLPVLASPPSGLPDRAIDFRTCPAGRRECYHATAILTGSRAEAPVVYAAARTPGLLRGHLIDISIGVQVALLVGLAGWVAAKATGRALGTIDNIKAELAHITASDLSRRVCEPPGDDEISGLARTVNSTLARLEHSVEQQRRFAADASHELRTPIAGLRAQLEDAWLYPEDTDLRSLVQGTLRDTDRIETIITDLLFMARLGSSGPAVQERVDLGRLTAEEIRRCGERVPVAADLQDDVMVHGVPTHLVRVVANLLDNAQRHADRQVTVQVRATRGTAVLSVTNDGDRIPVEDRERVFQRFTRLDEARSRNRGGTGLGLAIARDVAIAHDGTLRVEDCSTGTRFVLRLPVAE
ncbi:HAMP domain-containing sensor histidine kinase [Sphaerisporangium rubeum]|uniref:histidine kinase n=1 Tax=Sphaerisporangium rubeum TaxID=321317 RepID=A0A7X0M758_9ACTN|nr:ATP-binding protein [Sphaerisporangium rubeum]MBB6474200.1 signal transduction histidine kinase [Sphaerisporangium rubeum]